MRTPNAEEAVLTVLQSRSGPFTAEELIEKAAKLTGRTLSRASLRVVLSNLRADGATITRGPEYSLWKE